MVDQKVKKFLEREFGISKTVIDLSEKAESKAKPLFDRIERIRGYNQLKVIKAFQRHHLSDSHFAGTTGYGYGDRGRDLLDAVYADVFKTEDALVRHQIVSGTQALALCMFGNLRPGDILVSATGKPYDTLEEVIGIRGEGSGSLKDFGITYSQVELAEDGSIDLAGIASVITAKTKMVLIQRSRGYSQRRALSVREIGVAVKSIRDIKNDVIILVDNCYGEFTEEAEPTEAGADLAAGSLIKNPGGGLAPTGGYIAGREKYVYNAACRLTSPGLGKKVGASLGNNRLMFQGLYMAPHVVAESLRGAIFCSEIMGMAGFLCNPAVGDERYDIIQAVDFGDSECLIEFCRGIQKGSPVDSHVMPEPWDMPGYDSPVIMAAGAFIQGASIELSADAPVKPPYTAYMQGGLVYENVVLAVMTALQRLKEKGLIDEDGRKSCQPGK